MKRSDLVLGGWETWLYAAELMPQLREGGMDRRAENSPLCKIKNMWNMNMEVSSIFVSMQSFATTF